MQKIISKFALAAHLALMAVAPLFLLPFAGEKVTSTVLFWLSAFGVMWLLMEPSRRRGEQAHDARARVVRSMLTDPLFWFSLVVLGLTIVRSINSGIALAYDAELMKWSLRELALPLFPGCVEGMGLFPFAAVLSLVIVMQGARHALGRDARSGFLFVCTYLSSMAALALAVAHTYQYAPIEKLIQFSTFNATYFGTAFGIAVLCGCVTLFDVVEQQWVKAEPLAVIGLVGNAIGLVLFSPLPTLLVFAAAFLLLVICSFILERRRLEGSGSFRCALSILMTIIAPVLYVLADDQLSERMALILEYKFFAEDFFQVRAVLSDIALKTWKTNPWLGTGLGSFPLDIRFAATTADWSVVSPSQITALSGWWQLLAERGVIGAAMIAVTLGFLLWTYFFRLVSSFSHKHFSPEHLLGPFAILPLVALAFVDCSYLRPEVLLLVGSFMALSGGAFPRVKHKDADGEKGSKHG